MSLRNETFNSGRLPEEINGIARFPIGSLNGIWKEYRKPKDQIIEFLKRIGIGGIKSRFVAKTHSTVEITLQKSRDLRDFEDSASTEPATEACSPSELVSSHWNDKQEEVSGIQSWYIKQNFPMGRSMEMHFVSDGITSSMVEEPETGSWECLSYVEDNVLYCLRTRPDGSLSLYETRCVIEKPDDIESKSDRVQFFQWVLVNHSDTAKSLTVSFYLLGE